MNDQTLTLLDLLAKGTAVLFLGLGGITFMRRHSAAQRSLAWFAVFGAMLMLPLVVFVRPVWTVEVPLVKVSVPLVSTTPPQVMETRGMTGPIVMPVPDAVVAPAWTIWQWLGAIYVSGMILVLGFRVTGSWQLRWLQRGATGPDARIREAVRRLRKLHGIRRRIRVLQSDRITVPMTWGTLKPVLMLPCSCSVWTDADLRSALEHELAHIRHLDAARRWMATLVSALWWPHPLVWIASKAWRLEQERACDDAVVRSGADAERYAGQLLHAAGSVRPGRFHIAAALVMAMPSGLETRVRSVVGTGVNRSATGRPAFLITMAAGLFVVMICAVCQAQTEAPAKEVPRQICITSKFVEVASGDLGTKHPALKKSLEGAPVTLSDTEMEELWQEISQKKGVNLMSAPVVTTHSGQKATVEVARKFNYPISYEKDSHTPTASNMIPFGVMVEVEPEFQSNGSIRLHPIKAKVNEFLGFMAGGRLHLLPKDKDASSHFGMRPTGDYFDDRIGKLLEEWPRDGSECHPVFSTRKWSGDVSLKQGQWLVSCLKRTDDVGGKDSRCIWFFMSAKEQKAEAKKSVAAPAVPTVGDKNAPRPKTK